MQKILINVMLLLVMAITLIGCTSEKKDDPAPTPTPAPVPNVPNEGKCLLVEESLIYEGGSKYLRENIFEGERLVNVKETYDFVQQSISKYVFEYDAKGFVSKVNSFDGKGKLFAYYTFEHDTEGLLKKFNWYIDLTYSNLPLELYLTSELTYNEQKQLVSLKSYMIDGASSFKVKDLTYTYSDAGNIASMQEYRVTNWTPSDMNDIVINRTYTYDDKVNPFKEHAALSYINPTTLLLSQNTNNMISNTSATTLEGTLVGPPANFDYSSYNFTQNITYTYDTQDRPLTSSVDHKYTRSFKYSCE